MDLGDDLKTYDRGAPSILSELSIEYDGAVELGNTTIYYSNNSCFLDGKKTNMLKEINIAYPDNTSCTSDSANYEMFLTIYKSKTLDNNSRNGENDYGGCRYNFEFR